MPNPALVRITPTGSYSVPDSVKYIRVADRKKKVYNPSYQPSAERGKTPWNQFVKDNYKRIKDVTPKKENGKIDKKLIFDELSRRWKESKDYRPPKKATY
jgi:hypothetical protein